MKYYELTKKEGARYQRDPGSFAEEIAAFEYGYSQNQDSGQWDIARESGATIEVKSTTVDIGQQYEHAGRFRLWQDQHEGLVEYDRSESAFYVFVLFDNTSRPLTAKMVRRNPADIGNTIAARGGWNQTGHKRGGGEYKLPISAVFEDHRT